MPTPDAVTIGIDPGTVVTGWGVVARAGSTLHHVASGAIRTSPDQPMPDRLLAIFNGLCAAIEAWQPRDAAIESLFHARNAGTGIKLGQARGAALVAAARLGLPVSEYLPSQVKKALVGYGAAEKTQVQHMVSALLGVKVAGPLDTTDALGLAICHLHGATGRAIEAASPAPRRRPGTRAR